MRRFIRGKSAITSTEIMLGITLIMFVVFAMLGAFDKGTSQISSDSDMRGVYQSTAASDR